MLAGIRCSLRLGTEILGDLGRSGEISSLHLGTEYEAREDDCDGHRQVLQVVIGEANHDRHQQPACGRVADVSWDVSRLCPIATSSRTEGKHAHHRPRHGAEAVQPALRLHLSPVALPYGEELQWDRKDAQLHVAHPERRLVACGAIKPDDQAETGGRRASEASGDGGGGGGEGGAEGGGGLGGGGL